MRRGYFAYIVPVSHGHPEHPIELPPEGGGGLPDHIWGPTDPRPTPPIVIIPPEKPGQPPVVIWPSPGHPAHPIAPGGPPPSIWPSPGHPAHPIVLPPAIIWPQPPGGGPPVVIWPGRPEHPIVLPKPPGLDNPHPEHPIVIPLPPEIWPNPGRPAHPIVIPPEEGTLPPDEPIIVWEVGWSEQTGWVVVGVPNTPHPAPSKRR